jgi:hypothetical protein
MTTNVVSSNPLHGEVYSIQHYVIEFSSNLRHVSVFLCHWNIVESGPNTISKAKAKTTSITRLYKDNYETYVLVTNNVHKKVV